MNSAPEEKRSLLGDGSAGARASRTSARWRTALITAACAGLAIPYLLLPPLAEHAAAPTENNSVQYDGESISWSPCGHADGGLHLECSTIYVVLDHFAPPDKQEGDISKQNFSIPLIRLRDPGNKSSNNKAKAQNLLINPGGPGESGIDIVRQHGPQMSAIVGQGFHVMSFDPRGVHRSRPRGSCYETEALRRDLSPARPLRYDSGGERGAEMFAQSANFARACADVAGYHGRFLNTPQTAADMNDILDALGQRDMVYWGLSYGSILGQTYAAMYPERSARVIIDGIGNQFDWYDSLLDVEALSDTEKVLDGFFAECIKVGEDKCALASMANSKEDLLGALLAFSDKIRKQPLSVYVDSTIYGLFTHADLWDSIFLMLYKPSLWSQGATLIRTLLDGDPVPAFLFSSQILADDGGAELESFIEFNDGRSGPAHWPQDRDAARDTIAPFLNGSMFAQLFVDDCFRKQQWAVPRTHGYVPRRDGGVKTKNPLLILSMTYDPIAPLVSARSARDAFVGSQIVEVRGYGHCSISMPSLCAAAHVRAFLYEGKVPDKHTRCQVDGEYFLGPGEVEDEHLDVLARFADPEERKIHEAQVKLARNTKWPIWR